MKKYYKVFSFLLFVLILSVSAFLAYQVKKDLEVDDSGAMYGGEVELAYPSAGYLIALTTGSSKTCGYAVLNNTIAVTAAHCVDDATNIYLGKGDFSYNEEDNLRIDKATQREGWVTNKTRDEDFAVLKFTNKNNFFKSFAEVASPTEGCHYRVVAYGKTEDPSEAFTKPRKSALYCAEQINANTIWIRGKDSGICFGDSGSPVYIDGTNQIVGVVASIIHESENTTDPCDFNNTAIVTRADANLKLIKENIQEVSATDESLEGLLTIEVAEKTFLEKIGLRRLENLDEEKKYTYLLVFTLGFTLTLFFITMITLLVKGNKAPEGVQFNPTY